MIIRVLHEGQYEITDEALRRVNELDDEMFRAVVAGDMDAYRRLIEQVLGLVRQDGNPLAVEDLRPSELVLPAPDSTLEEVRALFVEEGLIDSD